VKRPAASNALGAHLRAVDATLAAGDAEPIPPAAPDLDPVESAEAAGLRYVTDAAPGIARRKNGASFAYVDAKGARIRDAATIARVKALAIPPAWTAVWICADARGHLQATGRDARGRKQYRYHARYRRIREETKFGRMIEFAQALPKIRKRVAADLRRDALPREKVLATIVRLLDTTFIRVGNDEYATQNGSYGLTTMRNKHVEVRGARVRFEFKGKSGKTHSVDYEDARVAKIVRRCKELPGYELFRYVGDDGELRSVDSSDVNDYLREVSGTDFTAKDFRTWGGTVLAACALRGTGAANDERETKSNIARAVEQVAAQLGNTPAVCRKSYVHPAVLDAYTSGVLLEAAAVAPVPQRASATLRADERAVLQLLRKLKRQAARTKRAA
jgi:DNA topoisomerase-1